MMSMWFPTLIVLVCQIISISAQNFTDCRYGYLESSCNSSVCSYDSYCCYASWDNICAEEACTDGHCSCRHRNGTACVTEAPYYNGTYDFFVKLYPEFNETTIHNVDVTNADDNQESNFAIYFQIADNETEDCIDPHITLEFERIDYDQKYEYMEIIQNDGTIITKCGGGVANKCGTYKTCLDFYNLRDIDMLYTTDDPYILRIFESYSVDGLCTNHSNSINVRIQWHCLDQAAPPTTQPTIQPTGQYCGYDTWNQSCFEHLEFISPSFTEDTLFQTVIQNVNDDRETVFYVVYEIDNSHDCVDPRLTFIYERIDYDSFSWEYLDIADNREGDIERCRFHNNSCGNFATCLDQYNVKASKIESDEVYIVVITESSEVDALCFGLHNFSINAQLTLECSAGTAIPTSDPTTEMPTPPTTWVPEYTCDDVITGENIPYGVDWYDVSFAGGDLFNVTFDSCNSSFDTWLHVVDLASDNEDGNGTIASCDDCGPCGTRTVLKVNNLVEDHPYALGVGGFASSYGAYEVEIKCDYITDPVTCGDSVHGITSYSGDTNWMPFVIDHAVERVMFDTCESEFDTYVYLEDSNRNIIQKCDDCGDCNGKAQMEVLNLNTGYYILGIGGFKQEHGTYKIEIVCNKVNEPTTTKGGSSGNSSSSGNTITLAIVIPLVVLIVAVIVIAIVLFYYRKKAARLQKQIEVGQIGGTGGRILIDSNLDDGEDIVIDDSTQNIEYAMIHEDDGPLAPTGMLNTSATNGDGTEDGVLPDN